MKIIWFFFSLCLLVGCKRSDVAVSVEQTLPVIDLNAAYPEKKLDLAEVASPEYIPLYTVGADSLDRYSLTSASVSPHWVVAYNWQQTIMVLNGQPENFVIVLIIRDSKRTILLYILGVCR